LTAIIPREGFHTITPYLIVEDGERIVEFLNRSFDATVELRHDHPDGTIRHAELQIGDSKLMLSQAREGFPAISAMIFLYLDDVDDAHRRALAAGATSLREPTDESHGDRMCGLLDPCGGQWWFATPIAPRRRP
jgi:PhnB protein